MPDYFAPEILGRTQSLTPEGFLLCRDVPISRVGTLLYAEHELTGLEALAGILHVERLDDEVFAPQSIASYAGKPVIVTHAGGSISPTNFRDHMVGTVLNPRRGSGEDANCVLADLLIYDADTIAEIRAHTLDPMKMGGYQVSAGYSAEYEQLGPGRARQYDIIGNHVALVESGRCGPRCSIGDASMPTLPPRTRVRLNRPTMDARRMNAIRKAFLTRDEDALENALNTAGPDGVMDDPMPDDTDNGGPTNITVNISGAGVAAPTDPVTAPPGVVTGPPVADAMPSWAAPIVARLDAIEAKMGATTPAPAPTPDPVPPIAKDPTNDATPAEMAETEAELANRRKEEDKMTTDSASTKALFQETMAAAEILAPGVKLLTMDGKMTVKQTHDSLCDFRRSVLARATADAAMGKKISPLTAGKDLKRISCADVTLTFDASAALVKALNGNNTMVGFMPRPTSATGTSKVMTPAEINIAAKKLHGIVD